jgi:membrane-associated phospholipid phosphatase
MSYLLTKAPYWITRFGEIGIVLPMALVLAVWMVASTRSLRPVMGWLVPLGLAVAATTASKIAFIGWGLGIAALDFTGFSGHAMFSAAIYPVLAYTLTAHARNNRTIQMAVLGGYALALLIAWSRVHIQVHSWSEVVAGFALGASASAWTIWRSQYTHHGMPGRWALLAVVGWLSIMPLQAAPSRSHDIVTRLALELAAHDTPFRRADMHKAVDKAP